MNTSELTITTERIDDFALLIEMMKQIDVPEMLDRHLPRHWLQEVVYDTCDLGWVGCATTLGPTARPQSCSARCRGSC